MRIPLTNVHRAFPELDRFSDEQCERFVRAACKRGWGRHLHRAGIGCLAFPLGLAAIAGGAALSTSLDETFKLDRGMFAIVTIACFAAAFAIPGAVVLLTKDRLLLRRIRYVLRDRAVCPSCRYSLLGMVVGENNIVVCPECGMEVEADPSLNELASDEGGRVLFSPSERVGVRAFWTAKRRRRAKRAGIGLAALLLVVAPAGLGGYELFLRRQASVAARERPGVEGVTAFVEAGQRPGVSAADENVWDILLEEQMLRPAIDATIENKAEYRSPRTGAPVGADFQQIYSPDQRESGRRVAEENRLAAQLALDLLTAYREQGLLDIVDSMAGAPRAVEQVQGGVGQPLIMSVLPTLGEARHLTRVNGARMHLAAESGDRAEFVAALESTLALARLCEHQATLIQGLTGISIEQFATRRARACIARHPDGLWLDEIEAAIERQRPDLPRNHAIEGERLYLLDAVAWVFSDPGNVRLGRFSRVASNMGGGFGFGGPRLPGRLGTYAQNRDQVNACMDQVSDAMLARPFERGAWDAGSGGYILLDMLLPSFRGFVNTIDERDADREGTRTAIALERYYLAERSYPESLDSLVPDYLTALPTDPWTGETLRYRLLDPGAQTYVLYAVGKDGVDNGGNPASRRSTNPDLIFCPVEE